MIPKIRSLKDLTRVREGAQRALKGQLETGTTIYIGMGTCGIAAGARETMRAITDELARRKIQAHIETVGCIGMCIKEPLVDIQQAGKPRTSYANITPQMVPRLIDEHLVKGMPVREWVIARLPVELGA